jgi:hypothetical protein
MEELNWWLFLLTALIPLVIGHFWYGQLFKSQWLRHAEITAERAESINLVKVLLWSYLFGLLGSYIVLIYSVHQIAIFQVFLFDPATQDASSSISQSIQEFMSTYGTRHRTFGHGVIHGMELGLFISLPLIGMHTLLENRSFKYALIHIGFWIVCLALMGGVLCQFM